MKAALIFILISCSTTINWITYTDESNHFKINYPDKWTKQNTNAIVAFLSPKENDKDIFQENVNIMTQDLTQHPMTLDQYTELTEKQVIDNLGSSAIVSLKDISLAGQKAKELVYNMSANGSVLKMKQYWFLKLNKAYLLTYTAESSQFNKYESVATEIILNFSLY